MESVVSLGLARPTVRRYLRFFWQLQGACGPREANGGHAARDSNPQVAGSNPAGDANSANPFSDNVGENDLATFAVLDPTWTHCV